MRGMIYTLEAILGAVIILIGTAFIFTGQQQKEQSLSETSYFCLNYLDQNNSLRHYAINNMINELNDSLRSCLPSTADFDFRICASADCRDTKVPYNKTVYLSSYIIAGENDFSAELINLWVWLK